MSTNRRHAIAALTGAGLLWGTTVPLSKLALEWLPTGWLTVTRFGLAAAVLLPIAKRRGGQGGIGRMAPPRHRGVPGDRRLGSGGFAGRVRPRVGRRPGPALLASGAIGYGGTVIVQNAGITRTSVTHAALLIGAAPVLVAVIAALWQRTVARPVAWAGFALSLGGVGLVAGGGGGGATLRGDGLVLTSLLLAAAFTVGQTRLLSGRDPVAVTAVQFGGAALGAMVFTAITEGVPSAPAGPGPVLAVGALVAGGTLLPFTLFAYGQTRVSAEIAGAFLNLEPLVGAIAGAVVFGDPVGPAQVTGGAAILAGIGLSSLPLITGGRGRSGREQGQVGRPEPAAGGPGLLRVDQRQGADLVRVGAVGLGESERGRGCAGPGAQAGLAAGNGVVARQAARRSGRGPGASGPWRPGPGPRSRAGSPRPGRPSRHRRHRFTPGALDQFRWEESHGSFGIRDFSRRVRGAGH